MLARLFVTVGSLIVLALLAALVGPYFINWTSYRADFEREAGAILGRPVKVNGEASARLLPFPSVTFADVTVGDGSDGLPPTTVEQFSMDAELAPFLSGEVLIFDMRLVRPKTVVAVAPDGRLTWAVKPGERVRGHAIELERLGITGGELRFVRPGLPDRVLTDIEATLSAKALTGPWRAEGRLRADGHPMRISLSTGSAGADGMRLKLRAEPEGVKLVVDAEGNVAGQEGMLSYAGDFRLAEPASVVEGLRDGDGKPIEAKDDPGNRVRGKFTLNDKRLAIDEFRFETGPLADPYVADGSGAVEFGAAPSFSIKATGAQVRLGTDPASASIQSLSLAERAAQFSAALAELPKPALPGVLDIDLPAIVAGDTTIRDVRLSAQTNGGGWRIDRLNASLPGRSSLEASGTFEQGQAPGFKGKVLLAIGQPSGFAGWLAKDIDAPIRRLPRAGFSADVELSPGEQMFRNLELALGGARFKGTARRVSGAGEKPVVSLVLQGGATSADEAAALASLFIADDGEGRFAGQDVQVAVKAGPVGTGQLTAAGVDAAFRMADDRLDIDKLSIEGLAGASIVGTGRIEGLSGSPSGSADLTVISSDLAPLAALARSRLPDNRLLAALNRNAAGYPPLLTDARLDVLARGAAGDTLALDVNGRAGGSDISARFDFSGDRAKPLDAALALEAKLSNPDATAIAALAGLPSLPLGLVGKGELVMSMKGSAAKGLETSLAATSDGGSVSFDGTVLAPAQGLQLRGRAKLDATDIEPWLMTAGVALPGMGLGMETSLAADIDYGNGLLVLADLAGTVAESAVAGDLNIESRQGLPVVTGALETDELNLQPLAEMVLGPGSFDTVEAEWPTIPFKQTPPLGVQADLEVNAGTLAAGGAFAANDAALSLKLDSEGLRIPKISARLQDASLTGLFELKNSEATGLLTGQFRLQGARLERLLPGLGVEGAPLAGAADVSATLSGSGKSVGAMIASLAGSGTVSLRELAIGQLNPAAFPQLVAAADKTGRDIDAARIAAFAPPLIRSGSFAAGAADIPFTLAAGVVRLPPVSFGGEPIKLTSDLRLDLNTLDVAGGGELAYTPGVEELVGAEPTVNFAVGGKADRPTLALDTQPLAQFLTQRALEIEQARVEAMQDVLLEKQRLRREVRYYVALNETRAKAAAEKAAAEAEARRVAEEAARLKAEENAKRQAEADARRQAEEQELLKAEEEARRKAEEEAKRKADEEARRAEEARLKAEAEAKRQIEEQERLRAAEKARLKAEEEARLKAEEARKAEEERLKAEAEEEARLKAEEARKAEEERRKAEAEAKRLAEEQERLRTEEEARRRAREATPQQQPAAVATPEPQVQPDQPAPESAPRPQPKPQPQPAAERPRPARPKGPFPPAPRLPGNAAPSSSNSLQ